MEEQGEKSGTFLSESKRFAFDHTISLLLSATNPKLYYAFCFFKAALCFPRKVFVRFRVVSSAAFFHLPFPDPTQPPIIFSGWLRAKLLPLLIDASSFLLLLRAFSLDASQHWWPSRLFPICLSLCHSWSLPSSPSPEHVQNVLEKNLVN